MSDGFEERLKTLLAAPPAGPADGDFVARVNRRIVRIRRLRTAAHALAVGGLGALALLGTPAAMQAAESVNLLAGVLIDALEPLVVSPVGYVLGLLAAAAAVLHAVTD